MVRVEVEEQVVLTGQPVVVVAFPVVAERVDIPALVALVVLAGVMLVILVLAAGVVVEHLLQIIGEAVAELVY
jgi:hypothetical protein